MKNYARLFLLAVSLTSLTACGTFPVNPALGQFNPEAGYRFQNLELGPGNSESLFVIVSFSGGGTRAAALSYGVLEALENTKIQWKGEEKSLLDEVDLISSISGGSFSSGYYAVNRKEIFNGEFENDFLKHDVQADLIGLLLNPLNWLKLAGSSYSRSDLAAAYYNKNIFNGATYNDIAQHGTRPYVIINATDMTLGSQFPFIQDQFDLLCSDLLGLDVARAVASSSAFPGMLTPLTYENFSGDCGFTDYRWVERAKNDRRLNAGRAIIAENRISYYKPDLYTEGRRDYIHLVDGGVADNIGLRGPLYAISSSDPTYSIQRQINNGEIEKLVVIVVNAATDPDTARDKSSSVPGIIDNIFTAATVPLDNYSVDTVELLKAKINEYNSGYQYLQQCQTELQNACSASPLDVSQLNAVDLYVAEVGFDFIDDANRRHYFKNIGTNFYLKPHVIDELQEVGCNLLTHDPQLRNLLDGDPGFTGQRVTGIVPGCALVD